MYKIYILKQNLIQLFLSSLSHSFPNFKAQNRKIINKAIKIKSKYINLSTPLLLCIQL